MSEKGSVRSKNSRASRVSKGSKASYVDDSLFGKIYNPRFQEEDFST